MNDSDGGSISPVPLSEGSSTYDVCPRAVAGVLQITTPKNDRPLLFGHFRGCVFVYRNAIILPIVDAPTIEMKVPLFGLLGVRRYVWDNNVA